MAGGGKVIVHTAPAEFTFRFGFGCISVNTHTQTHTHTHTQLIIHGFFFNTTGRGYSPILALTPPGCNLHQSSACVTYG